MQVGSAGLAFGLALTVTTASLVALNLVGITLAFTVFGLFKWVFLFAIVTVPLAIALALSLPLLLAVAAGLALAAAVAAFVLF